MVVSDPPRRPPWLVRALIALVVLLASLWAAGAIWVDGPYSMAGGNRWLALGWLVAVLVAFWALRRHPLARMAVWAVLFLGVLIPWLRIAPSNDRDWKPEWAQTPRIEIDGGILKVQNFRDFVYAPDGAPTERWETRAFDLGNLRGMDYFHVPFGGDLLAHPMLSFDFGPEGHLVLSIETRREKGEGFSTVGGFYKMYELQYVWGSETDFAGVRSNIRGEPVHLYRTALSPEFVLFVLIDAVRVTNRLHDRPEFYNSLWANCTTALRAQTPEWAAIPFDLRMLANGQLDALIFEHGGFRVPDGLTFDTLREAALIDDAARAAANEPDFSTRIRDGRPGFD
jgi:hypothetical protein